ncbi:MAG: methyltransferase domain-containing protein [Pseudomonadota bacterium]
MTNTPDDILKRVSNLEVGDKSDAIYDDWSVTYDAHLLDQFGYISPALCADIVAEKVADKAKPIIDYGCGTGLVGAALSTRGFESIDGIDLSAGMLTKASSKGVYRQLKCGDLTEAIDLPNNIYDAGVCIGSMGAGHVGSEHVPGLLAPIVSGGLFVVIMNAQYYELQGFNKKFLALERDKVWRIERHEKFNYMDKLERPGWLLVSYKC